MTLAPHYQSQADEFFHYVGELQIPHEHAKFYYAAIRRGQDLLLLSGRLFLNVNPDSSRLEHFSSKNVEAGCLLLSELNLTPKTLLDALLTGSLTTPDGTLLFLPESNQYAAFHTPFHQEGIESQKRLAVLQLKGLQNLDFLHPMYLDWEIRASKTPFDGLQDLFFYYQLGPVGRDAVRVEFVTSTIAEVDFTARIEGTHARPAILLAEGFETSKVRLSYRVFEKGRVLKRGCIEGKDLSWSRRNGIQVGAGQIDVPQAAHLHCVASYNGTAQHFGWIVDSTSLQNSRRAAYETVDPKLENLQSMVLNLQERIRHARDLELVVSWLLWMLGFNPAHLGTHSSTQDAADVIVTTPAGHFAIVECTTGVLKTQKLSLLFERAQNCRTNLQNSGNAHLKVISAVVTTKTRPELGGADIEFAEKQGILVFTREDLERAVARTNLFPNADMSFAQAEQTIEAAYNKHNAQGSLPLGQN